VGRWGGGEVGRWGGGEVGRWGGGKYLPVLHCSVCGSKIEMYTETKNNKKLKVRGEREDYRCAPCVSVCWCAAAERSRALKIEVGQVLGPAASWASSTSAAARCTWQSACGSARPPTSSTLSRTTMRQGRSAASSASSQYPAPPPLVPGQCISPPQPCNHSSLTTYYGIQGFQGVVSDGSLLPVF